MRGNSQGLGTVLIFIAAAIALGFLYQVSHLLPPIILGLLLGYVLYPFIRLFDKFRVPRGLGVLLIFTLFVSGITYSASILSPLVRGEMELLIGTQSTGQSESKIYEIIDNISEQLYHYRLISENLNAEQVIDQLRDFLRAQNRRFIDSAGGAAAQAGQFMMIFLFVFTYTLLDGHKIGRTIIGFIPNSMFEPGTLMLHRTSIMFGAYLRGLVIENLILAICAFVMLLILGLFVPLSVAMCLLISLTIAFTNVIRIIGPLIGGAISVVYVLVAGADIIAIVGVLLVALAVQILDNAVVLPLVMKEQVNVHPVVSMLSVIAGGAIGGIIGMIIAIPVAGALKVVIQIVTVEQKRFQLY